MSQLKTPSERVVLRKDIADVCINCGASGHRAKSGTNSPLVMDIEQIR